MCEHQSRSHEVSWSAWAERTCACSVSPFAGPKIKKNPEVLSATDSAEIRAAAAAAERASIFTHAHCQPQTQTQCASLSLSLSLRCGWERLSAQTVRVLQEQLRRPADLCVTPAAPPRLLTVSPATCAQLHARRLSRQKKTKQIIIIITDRSTRKNKQKMKKIIIIWRFISNMLFIWWWETQRTVVNPTISSFRWIFFVFLVSALRFYGGREETVSPFGFSYLFKEFKTVNKDTNPLK